MDISKYRGVGGRGSRNMRGGRGSIPRIQRNLETPAVSLPIEISNPLSSLQKQFFSSHLGFSRYFLHAKIHELVSE